MTTNPSGLQFEDTVLGTGAIAKAGQNVSVHYTGWLFNDGVKGAKFDSSKDRGQPFQFSLGAGQVIKGWDEGVQGMSVGGTRRLIIPAELGLTSPPKTITMGVIHGERNQKATKAEMPKMSQSRRL